MASDVDAEAATPKASIALGSPRSGFSLGGRSMSRLREALSSNSRTYLNYLEEARRERLAWIDNFVVQPGPEKIGFDGSVDAQYASSDDSDSDSEEFDCDEKNLLRGDVGEHRQMPSSPDSQNSASVTTADAVSSGASTVGSPVVDVKASKFDESMVSFDENIAPCSILGEWIQKKDKFCVEGVTNRQMPWTPRKRGNSDSSSAEAGAANGAPASSQSFEESSVSELLEHPVVQTEIDLQKLESVKELMQ